MYKFLVSAIALFLAGACAPENRCGEEEFKYVDGLCILNDTDSDTGSDTGTDTDSNPDAATNPSSGLGEVCSPDGDECASYDADYCVVEPGTNEGYCSFDECAGNETVCPSPYQCCNIGPVSFCADVDDYATLVDQGMCQE